MENTNEPNMKYPTILVGPTSSGSCALYHHTKGQKQKVIFFIEQIKIKPIADERRRGRRTIIQELMRWKTWGVLFEIFRWQIYISCEVRNEMSGIGNWKVGGEIVKGIEPVVEVFHSLEFEWYQPRKANCIYQGPEFLPNSNRIVFSLQRKTISNMIPNTTGTYVCLFVCFMMWQTD